MDEPVSLSFITVAGMNRPDLTTDGKIAATTGDNAKEYTLTYTYDELSPASQMIALAARDMSDERVRDAAFSLFGHWGDERALKLLEAYNAPADPWMAMKYETLINDIREYALCKGNQ